MIAFVTSLRHPDNSDCYSRVEELLQRTLTSVVNQTSGAFIVIIVGNRRPQFPLPPHVEFIHVDFPAPAPPSGPNTALTAVKWDKGTKIGIGLIAAREYSPRHVMIFDADDFVNRDLAAFVADRPSDTAWVVSDGLIYSRRRNSWKQISNFHRTCGTCLVVPFKAYGVPRTLGTGASQSDVAKAYGDRLWQILGAHYHAMEWFVSHGTTVVPFPFPAAVYQVDTGENHSGKVLQGLAHPLNASVQRQFGITPSGTNLRSAWLAFGPRPFSESVLNFVQHRLVRKMSRQREQVVR